MGFFENRIRRVAFVSTRIAGTDGVSLEIGKWTEVLQRLGLECYFITGESNRPAERTVIIEEAHFNHPRIKRIADLSFGSELRTPALSNDIPNVMDFANPPAPPDAYSRGFRKQIGMKDDELLVLQPTRVVARKGIEHAIELVRRLDHSGAKLVITHASGDEGDAYAVRIREFAEIMGVELIFADRFIAEKRGTAADGSKLFTVSDVYPQADLVTYPSGYEGFGNAFLEAIYYRRPIVCNRYSIYRTDIEPCGFRTILFDGFLTRETVTEAHRVLDDAQYCHDMVEHNYEVASRYFGYDVIEDEIRSMMRRPQNVYRLLKRGNPV